MYLFPLFIHIHHFILFYFDLYLFLYFWFHSLLPIRKFFSLFYSSHFHYYFLSKQIMCNRSMSVLLSPFPSLSSSVSLKFLIYLVIVLTGIQSIEAFCDEHHWWQEQFGACIPCTVCEDGRQQSIVLRPCQPHSDTICGTLDDVEVELDWLKAAAVAAEHRQVCYFTQFILRKFQKDKKKKRQLFSCHFRSSTDQFSRQSHRFSGSWNIEIISFVHFIIQIENREHLGVIEKATTTMLMWDWQSLSLALAGLMCLLFFIVTACIYWQHSHYWKKLEQMEKRYNAGKPFAFNWIFNWFNGFFFIVFKLRKFE